MMIAVDFARWAGHSDTVRVFSPRGGLCNRCDHVGNHGVVQPATDAILPDLVDKQPVGRGGQRHRDHPVAFLDVQLRVFGPPGSVGTIQDRSNLHAFSTVTASG